MPHSKPKFMNHILDDIFYPDKPLCHIVKTSTVQKKDIFDILRPKSNSCVDYNISQTDLQVVTGNNLKLHVQETEASYVPKEEAGVKPKRRKIRFFNGGPPQWEFVDEKWRREQEEKQKVYRQQRQQKLEKAKKKRRR